MGKRCVWAMAIGLVLLGGAWNSAVGQDYDVTKVESLCLEAASNAPVAQDFGISNEDIVNHAYVFLKSKLHRLQMKRFAGELKGLCAPRKPSLFVIVNLNTPRVGERKLGYFGNVGVSLVRATLWESGKVGTGIAYRGSTILIGPPGGAREGLNKALDYLLTNFAAKYYEAGNP